MSQLDLAVTDELLATTRSIRRKLDLERPVDLALVDQCIELSLQAPTGSNAQGWRWLVVTDEKLRAGLADIYRRGSATYFAKQAEALAGDKGSQNAKVYSSAQYLVDVLHRVPVHVIPCVRGRLSDNAFANASMYGSILPAVWSFMLAARARNLGTVFTTLHLNLEAEAAELLGIPPKFLQMGLIPVAHTDPSVFRPVSRQPLDTVRFVDRWPTD
ncbi:nitroreductase family protein [Sporichthya brevicatena]|uniref:Nitroreductase family protein n=1 Tax=Sporichthya brevicatena TaxID=171442 RepID=A0ABP3RCN2_9ACTN